MINIHNFFPIHSYVICYFSYDSKANVPKYTISKEQNQRRKMMQNLEQRIIQMDYLKIKKEQISFQCPLKIIWGNNAQYEKSA